MPDGDTEMRCDDVYDCNGQSVCARKVEARRGDRQVSRRVREMCSPLSRGLTHPSEAVTARSYTKIKGSAAISS